MGLEILGIPAAKSRVTGPAKVRINAVGAISFNCKAVELIGLSEGDGVLFGKENGVFYVFRLDVDASLRVRSATKNGGVKSAMNCNCRDIVERIAACYDVEFGERVKSVSFELQKSTMSYNGSALYEVVNKVLDMGSLPLLSKNNK